MMEKQPIYLSGKYIQASSRMTKWKMKNRIWLLWFLRVEFHVVKKKEAKYNSSNYGILGQHFYNSSYIRW